MSGKYYPNNWDEIVNADDDQFDTCTYEEFMFGLSSWMIPSSHACIMRVENTDTGKIKEYSYRTDTGAANRIVKLADDPANVITVADNETIHLLVHPDNEQFYSTDRTNNPEG